MSFSIGIIGLPNVGKSTLFSILTKKEVDIASYPFTTIEPHKGIVAVPDERLKKISAAVKPKKTLPTVIEFVDIAGLVKNAHKGEGLGNQFLAQIRECDAVLEVVRLFTKDNVEHIERNIDAKRDIEIIKNELVMKDLETIENSLDRLNREAKNGNKKILKEIEFLDSLKKNLPINEQNLSEDEETKSILRKYNFLTAKTIIYVFNTNEEETKESPLNQFSLSFDFKLEKEISKLSKKEKEELGLNSKNTELSEKGVDQLILKCYGILDLITFYTIVGGNEARAWTIKRGMKVLQAAGKVHSDFEENFIKAEVISCQELISAGEWNKAKESGKIKTVGKDYLVQDGDVIKFKI